jgi:hypothetical protein
MTNKKKPKKESSVRDRVPALQKKEQTGGDGTGTHPEEPKMPEEAPTEKRIPATEADYLAAQLHEARSKLLELRGESLQKSKLLAQKDQIIIQREETILALEGKLLDIDQQKLRESHGLEFGRTLKRDDETGDVYWLEKPAGESNSQ